MQPKSNTRNLLLFIVLSALALYGSTRLQNWLWPPQPLKQLPAAVKPLDPRLAPDLLALVSGSMVTPAVPGVGNLSQLATDVAVANWLAEERPKVLLARKADKPPPPKQAPKAAPLAAGKREEITLGDDTFNLQVVVTTRGAGVQSVVLNRFKAANDWGRPVDSALALVRPACNRNVPSYVVYDYAEGDDKPQEALGTLEWAVVGKRTEPGSDKHEVTFSADLPDQDVRLIKTYKLAATDYHIGLTVEVQRTDARPGNVKFRYQLTGAHGLRVEGVWYTNTFHNALIGSLDAKDHLWRDFQDASSIYQSGSHEIRKGEQRLHYAVVAVQYFASGIVVDDDQQKKDFLALAEPVKFTEPDPEPYLDEIRVPNPKKPSLSDISVQVVTEPVELKPGDRVVHKYLLYNGPVKVGLLGDVGSAGSTVPSGLLDRYLNQLHLNTLADYQSPGVMGSIAGATGWSYLLIKVTNFMHGILGWLHALIPDYGVCIMLLTVLVRGLMHPISRKQARTSIKMQALVPELKKLQEKYKNDRQAQGMAQMELYRKHGVSPIGSCWVVFLQMPIFLGLYYALQESIHFRLAPFLWIKNLAAPDMLFYWGQNIPWINRPEDLGSFLYLGPYFNLLPVLAVALMIVQQKFLMPPPTDEAQEMQMKIMKYMMIFFGIMFYRVAAGLCIYFIVSSLWGLTERKLLPKAKPGATPAAPAAGLGGSSGKPVPVKPKPHGPKGSQTNGALKKVQEMWAELLKQAKKK